MVIIAQYFNSIKLKICKYLFKMEAKSLADIQNDGELRETNICVGPDFWGNQW